MLLPVSCDSSYPSVPQKPCWFLLDQAWPIHAGQKMKQMKNPYFWFLFLSLSYYVQMTCPSLLYSSCSKAASNAPFVVQSIFLKVPGQFGLSNPMPFSPISGVLLSLELGSVPRTSFFHLHPFQ